jgi:hypothetical protein
MTRFCLLFHLQQNPICPVCGDVLSGAAATIRDGIALCKICDEYVELFECPDLWCREAITDYSFTWVVVDGVKFLVPNALYAGRIGPLLQLRCPRVMHPLSYVTGDGDGV